MLHPQRSVYLNTPMGLLGQGLTLKWNVALCVLQEKNAKFLLNEHTVPRYNSLNGCLLRDDIDKRYRN